METKLTDDPLKLFHIKKTKHAQVLKDYQEERYASLLKDYQEESIPYTKQTTILKKHNQWNAKDINKEMIILYHSLDCRPR